MLRAMPDSVPHFHFVRKGNFNLLILCNKLNHCLVRRADLWSGRNNSRNVHHIQTHSRIEMRLHAHIAELVLAEKATTSGNRLESRQWLRFVELMAFEIAVLWCALRRGAAKGSC